MRIAGLTLVLAACRFPVPDVADGPACNSEHACPLGQFCDGNDRCERVTCAATVAAGDGHTCVIRNDHTAWCWGRNNAGQLGDGTEGDHSEPVEVANGKFIAISAGAEHTCAIDDDDALWCWGSNSAGQLGINRSSSDPSRVPVRIDALRGARAIATGEAHSCALLDDGTVWCWGSDESGQLGTEQAMMRSDTPQQVEGIIEATDIAAGGSTTCAIHDRGRLSCWGDNRQGQVGDGTTEQRPLPVAALSGDFFSRVAVGREFMCAIVKTGSVAPGSVYCIGSNAEGQLGKPAKPARPGDPVVPEKVLVPPPVIAEAITAGPDFACATVKADAQGTQRRLWCWGSDASHQLADGQDADHGTLIATPYNDVASVSGGSAHLCAVSGTGEVSCSGSNRHGQLGDGRRTTRRTLPPPMTLFGKATSIAAGGAHSCAVVESGVVCWGANDRGQLGDGSTRDRSTPVRVEVIDRAVTVVAGESHTCALLIDDTAMCWGSNADHQLSTGRSDPSDSVPRAVTDSFGARLTKIKQIAAGAHYTCALLLNGMVMCWGRNPGDDMHAMVPAPVDMMKTAKEIAVGSTHACVVNSDDYARCWGMNESGQLGDGDYTSMSRPKPLDERHVLGAPNGSGPLLQVSGISSHGKFTCSVTGDGVQGVVCWGSGKLGQLGDGKANTVHFSQAVTGLGARDWKVAAGGEHACAFRGQELRCWGLNEHGQVGDGGSSNASTPVPITIPENATVAELAAGGRHTCARFTDGRVTCWGDAARGQLGDGSFDPATRVTPRLHCE